MNQGDKQDDDEQSDKQEDDEQGNDEQDSPKEEDCHHHPRTKELVILWLCHDNNLFCTFRILAFCVAVKQRFVKIKACALVGKHGVIVGDEQMVEIAQGVSYKLILENKMRHIVQQAIHIQCH